MDMQLPIILFLVIVAPIWVIMHYVYKNKARPAAVTESAEDRKQIEELLAMAGKMESRIETLEAILDKKDPNWRHEV